MLTEKQLYLIKLLVEGNLNVTESLKEAGVATSTYYDWRRDNKTFKDAYDDAVEERVREAKKSIRADVKKYIDRLDKLSDTGANENARVNAIAKLLTLAELDPKFTQEISIQTNDEGSKNYMLELLEKKHKE